MPAPIVWRPTAELVEGSNLAGFLRQHGLPDYDALLARAERDPDWWWRTVADRISFVRPYGSVLNLEGGPAFARWCEGGQTNIVLNALDRHRDSERWEATALVHETEDGRSTAWSYRELDAAVCRLAGGLRSLGLGRREVVALHLPNVPEAVIGMLAVAKVGAVPMPLFSGFGAEAIRSRLVDSGAALVLTADGATRRGRPSAMKSIVDQAVAGLDHVRHVICLRTGTESCEMMPGRDRDWQDLCAGQPDAAPTEVMEAEDPCLLMYTSGTTGRPKGTVHAHAGFAAKLALDLGLLMDLKPSDRVLWMSDMGWLIGPILSFGMPIVGASFVLAEGAPDYPDPDRLWRLVESHRVTFLGLAPTIVRSFMGGVGTGGRDLSSLRICASTGEAWTPDAWSWTFENVCRRALPILNYSGGTEIGGGIVTGTVLHPMKPCAFSGPIPGMGVDVADAEGRSVPAGTVGELVLRRPSIGQTRGFWNDRARYLESYWTEIPGVWRHGDWAMRDQDGFWFVLGRSDDTLKIAGKRTGPAEIEALLTATGAVAEAAAIGLKDPVKGEAVGCVVVMPPGRVLDAATRTVLEQAVVTGLGYPYRPALVASVPELPKTRNMKVMRRLIRAVLAGEPPGDISSLGNPEALQGLRAVAQSLAGRTSPGR